MLFLAIPLVFFFGLLWAKRYREAFTFVAIIVLSILLLLGWSFYGFHQNELRSEKAAQAEQAAVRKAQADPETWVENRGKNEAVFCGVSDGNACRPSSSLIN